MFRSSDGSAQTPAGSSLVLRDHWAIRSSENLTKDGGIISQPGYAAANWQPTSVPSTVLAALVANQVYPDPYYGNNYLELPGERRWDKPEGNPFESSWWYRTEFDLPSDYAGKRVWLKFHGVNYRANLWVNGRKVADVTQMEGAYRLYSFDIAQFVKAGQKNGLALEIFPPKGFDLAISWVDWNPTPPDRGMGIWYDVSVSASGSVAIDHPFVKTKLNLPATDQARLTVVAEVKNTGSSRAQGVLKGTIDNIAFTKEVSLEANETREVTFSPGEFPQLVVANPRLWWPHTVGPQNLYDLNLSFETDGKVSDTRHLRFGIR
jgi:exo-1,4-beta-D-glucosaminidase